MAEKLIYMKIVLLLHAKQQAALRPPKCPASARFRTFYRRPAATDVSLKNIDYVLDIGIGLEVGRCSLAGNKRRTY